MVIDLKEELEQARLLIQKLQADRRELAEEAKTARAYRDELEMLKVQESKVDKLEADLIKYKQKAEDTEYLKKKIQVGWGQDEVWLKGRGGAGWEVLGGLVVEMSCGVELGLSSAVGVGLSSAVGAGLIGLSSAVEAGLSSAVGAGLNSAVGAGLIGLSSAVGVGLSSAVAMGLSW